MGTCKPRKSEPGNLGAWEHRACKLVSLGTQSLGTWDTGAWKPEACELRVSIIDYRTIPITER